MCGPIKCTECRENSNAVQVTFGQDDMKVKCVNEQDLGCADAHHAVGAVRRDSHEQCSEMDALGDKRLLVNGNYFYLDDSCSKKSCQLWLTASETCKNVSGKEITRCVPEGFLTATKELIKLEDARKQ